MNKALLDSNPNLLMIKGALRSFLGRSYQVKLIGGAVSDILDGKTPKDYDFVYNLSLKQELDKIAILTNVSKTAITYNFNDLAIQLVYKNPNDFPFTIEQASYLFNNDTLEIDEQSFNTKLLVPSEKVFRSTEPHVIINALRRYKHWETKGYIMNRTTYNSLLSALSLAIKKAVNSNIEEEPDES